MMKYYTENEALNMLINGQPEALSYLYCIYQPVMLKYAKKKFSNIQEAEDIIQEIFLSLWRRRNRISENLPIKYYLLGAIHLKYAQHCRHNSVKNKYLAHLYRITADSKSSNELEGKELGILIKLAYNKISAPACKKVFELAFFQEKDCREISEIMNIKPQVVRNQTSRALKIIREHLKKVI